MPSSNPLRVVLLAFVTLIGCALPLEALAGDADADVPSFDVLLHDDEPPPEPLAPRGSSPLWLTLGANARRDDHSTSFGAVFMLALPLDRLWDRGSTHGARARAVLADPAPRLKPAPGKSEAGGAPPIAPRSEESALPPPPPLPIPVAIGPADARAAVRAALREARLSAPDAELDALASRARNASLLPELRLRAMRLVDEDESLAPTEYDPARTTASGGTSLWLEARATWRLDRLVFADDEIAIERMRSERAAAQRKVTERVLELLFSWQRAVALEADVTRSPDEHRGDTLMAIEHEAALDVATGGWFSAWLAKRR